MKAVIAVLALAATAGIVYHVATNRAPSANVDELWSSWKVQHGRVYSASEEILRKAIFAENFAAIEAHNADSTQTFKKALNKFADLTGEEFKEKTRCMAKASNTDGDEYCPGNHGCPTLPKTSQTKVDWRTKGGVTPVKNQGQCGSCWAFSTIGGLESHHHIIQGKPLVQFSESQLVDCAKSCYGCEGCWTSVAYHYTQRQGNVLESLYPYKAYQRTCHIPKNATLYKINNNGFQCVTQKNRDQFVASIAKQPTSIAVEADQGSFQFYTSGIVTSGCGDSLDHAILAVGFDLDAGYYIVKNSWGSDWGENGYIRIGTDNQQNDGFGVCGILRCADRPY